MLLMGYILILNNFSFSNGFFFQIAMRFTENLKDNNDFRININLMGIVVATVC